MIKTVTVWFRQAGGRGGWVAQYRASGLGLKRVAAGHGLLPGQLHYWVYAPGRTSAGERGTRAFEEVRWTGSLTPPSGWAAEIAVSSGATVRLREGAAPKWVRALIQALGVGGSCSR